MKDCNKLIADLKEDAEWAAANEWETPIMLSDHITQAIEAIEFFSNRLCDTCGVCQADKRNPFNCEIAGTGHE